MEFANILRTLRNQRNLTQQQLADALYVDKTSVCKWESGAYFPNQTVMIAISDYFNVSLDYLFGRSTAEKVPIDEEQKSTIKMELKKIRKKRHLTQQNVADFSQIPLRTYANYELGSRKPTPEMLCRLADFFDITIDELLGRTSAPALFDDARVERPEILELFESLTPNLQEHAIAYLHGLADRSALQNRANVNIRFNDIQSKNQ